MSETQPEQLVVAFNFPPFNDGSAVTVAKRIVENQNPVDVVTADLSRVRSKDSTLSDLVSPWVNRVHQLSVPIKFADESSIRPFVTRGLHALRGRAYTSVYSRSMWPHSHFIAAHVRATGIAGHWTAEFSDPILWHVDATRRPSGKIIIDNHSARVLRLVGARGQRFLLERKSVLEWAQFVPFLAADELVFTNSQQQDVMIADAPAWMEDLIRAKSTISPHPTLPASYYGSPHTPGPRVPGGRFRIGYFGNFYPNRGGGELLEAMSTLAPDSLSKLQLDIYTENPSTLLRLAIKLRLENHVNTHPPLPFIEFLRESNSYDALLVNDIATSPFGTPSPFLPSKYSDYAGSTAPTMAISLAGSPLDCRAAEFKARTGDIDSIRLMLQKAIA